MNNHFIIAGAQKSGTTSIFDLLSQNNEVSAKEIYKDFHVYRDVNRNKKYINDILSAKKNIIIHCAVNYMTNKNWMQNIYEIDPATKIILILRNPIKRTISAINYFQRMGVELRSLEDIIDQEIKSPVSLKDMDKSYLMHGLYFKQLKENILPFFNLDNIGVFFYEDIFTVEGIKLESLLNFIGIPKFDYDKYYRVNQKGNSKYPILNKTIFSRSEVKSKLARLVPIKIRYNLKRYIYSKNRSKDSMMQNSESLECSQYQELRNFFRKDVRSLEKLLKVKLLEKWEI